MKLAAGTITTAEKSLQLYYAQHTTNLSRIYLNNGSVADVTINLYIQYEDVIVRVLEKDTQITAGDDLMVELPYELSRENMVRIEVDTDTSLSYILEGTVIPQAIEDILISNLTDALTIVFDERYTSITDSSGDDITVITDYSTAFTGLYSGKYFFDCDETDIVFDNVTFFGTIWIRNTGTVTFTGTADGGTVYCSGEIPTTVVGESLMPDDVFPTQLT